MLASKEQDSFEPSKTSFMATRQHAPCRFYNSAYIHKRTQRHTLTHKARASYLFFVLHTTDSLLCSAAIDTVDRVLDKVDEVQIVVKETVNTADGWVRTIDGWAVKVIFAGSPFPAHVNPTP
jgi:hypothetical protein